MKCITNVIKCGEDLLSETNSFFSFCQAILLQVYTYTKSTSVYTGDPGECLALNCKQVNCKQKQYLLTSNHITLQRQTQGTSMNSTFPDIIVKSLFSLSGDEFLGKMRKNNQPRGIMLISLEGSGGKIQPLFFF